jgi:hypothetical protein
MDGPRSGDKNQRRARASVPQPRLASKERTRTWGTRADLKIGITTLAVGCGLVIPASVGLLISSVPTVLTPFPAMTAIPALVSSRAIAIVVPSLFFFAWNAGLLGVRSQLPNRSYWLLIIATILSVIWFVVGWRTGLHYQGPNYVHRVLAVNVVWLGCLATLFARFRQREVSLKLILALHFLLFTWLAWYALPYLGELP